MEKKLSKPIKITAFVLLGICFLLGLYILVSNAVILLTTYEDTGNPSGKYDCILVLGAGVKAGGEPSDMLRDRLDTAIAAYSDGYSDRILMTGDHSDPYYDEPGTMKKYAIGKGIASSVVFLDHVGLSTYDSIYRASREFGAGRILIVTQSYHLPRAIYIAESLGMEADGLSADLRTYRGQTWFGLREIAARSKDFFYSVCKPVSTYVGGGADLSSDGDGTNDNPFFISEEDFL